MAHFFRSILLSQAERNWTHMLRWMNCLRMRRVKQCRHGNHVMRPCHQWSQMHPRATPTQCALNHYTCQGCVKYSRRCSTDLYIYTHRRRVYIYIVCFCADMLVTHINIYTHTQTHTTHTCLHPYVPTHLPIPTYLYIPTYKYQPTCTGTPRHDTFTHHIDWYWHSGFNRPKSWPAR